MTRASFLSDLIGKPWDWKTHNCWTFASLVEASLFHRTLPHVDVPDDPSWRWMLATVGDHPEHNNWQERPLGPHGIVTAGDGALCLMGRISGPGHIGVWLKPEGRVLHCDQKAGVCFETPLALRQSGWRSLRFYEPK